MDYLNLDELLKGLVGGYGNECSCDTTVIDVNDSINLDISKGCSTSGCSINDLNLEEKKASSDKKVPVGISNRHIHLSQRDLDILFGPNYQLTPIKDLKQPGQFACKETIVLAGPKGCFEKVRILGPVRPQTQIEVSQSDLFKLGLKAPVRESGDLAGSGRAIVIGPKGQLALEEGLIVAKRHIHMHTDEAKLYGLQDQDIVSVKTDGEKGLIFQNVLVRVGEKHALEYHIDTDEANAAGLSNSSEIEII